MEEEDHEDSYSEENLGNFASEIDMLRGKTIKDDYPDRFEDISEEEIEDYTIKKTDALLCAAKMQGEYSTLEIYIYEENRCNLFVHHEIVLSAFPLCMEFLPIHPINYT